MPLDIPKPVSALLVKGVLRSALCWTITRLDGEVIRLTDHNASLVVDGDTYSPIDAITASARQKLDNLRTHTLEAGGALSSSLITEADLKARKYDYATVSEFTVDWKYPYNPYDYRTYTLGEVQYTSEQWSAQVLGLVALLKRRKGYNITRTCRWTFGDTFCGFNLATVTNAATVTSITQARRAFTSSTIAGLGRPDGYYDGGLVVWDALSNNPNHESEIKSYLSNGTIELQLRTPRAINASDPFTVYPGCAKTIEACKGFNNYTRFGGFPTVPGTDKAHDTPDAHV